MLQTIFVYRLSTHIKETIENTVIVIFIKSIFVTTPDLLARIVHQDSQIPLNYLEDPRVSPLSDL